MGYLLLFGSVMFCGAQGIFYKLYSDNAESSAENSSYTFSAVMGICCAVVMFCFAGFTFNPSPVTVLIAVIQASVYFLYNFCLMKALITGASYSMISISIPAGAIVCTFIETVLIYKEAVDTVDIIAISLILLSLVLANYDGLKNHTIELRHFFFYIALFIINGVYSVLVDVHQRICNGTQRTELMIITYICSAVLAVIALCVKNRKFDIKEFGQTPKSLMYMLFITLNATTQIYLIMYLIETIQYVVVLSISNGGSLAAASIYSYFFLKDKLSPMRILGICIITACIVIMSIF